MAAARPLPEAQIDIDIAVGGTVSINAYIKVSSLESIVFQNNAGFPVNIVFTNTLTSISDLPNGQPSAAQGGSTPLNVTVNYVVKNAVTDTQTGGPYAIQFGLGPLPVSITSNNTKPDPIAIPALGQIAFTADAAYPIAWTFQNGQAANVWNPEPPNVSKGANSALQALAGASGKTLTYTLGPVGAKLTQGKGTVKVGS